MNSKRIKPGDVVFRICSKTDLFEMEFFDRETAFNFFMDNVEKILLEEEDSRILIRVPGKVREI